jgi:hypothetical protein
MISTKIILIIIFHWIADFIFQDEEWATNKSKYTLPLLKHTLMYSIIWLFPIYWISGGDLVNTLMFVGITFIAHTITDYFTSKVVSNRFSKQHYGSPIPNFGAFTIIGFDQVLHYVQLVLTWNLLFG